jgi:HlyD family secretion protein
MKKWIVLLLVLAAVFGGWYYVTNYVRFTPNWMKPTLVEISRGDIRVPVTASGLIEPESRIQVKSKASGEVVQVSIEPGDFVRRGETLVVLKRDTEQRNFDRAKAELDRAKALLAQSRVNLQRAESSVVQARAQLAQLEAVGRLRAFDLERVQQLKERGGDVSEKDVVAATSQFEMNQADKQAAQASVTAAELAVSDAREAIAINQAAVEIAQAAFGDAEERLADTKVVAQEDALVTSVNVEVGEVIQGGAQNLTGGTVLAELADISELKVIAKVDEAEYGRVLSIAPRAAWPQMDPQVAARLETVRDLEEKTGDVRLFVDAFPEDVFTGRIGRVEPQGRLNTGSSVIQYDVHVIITDEKRRKLLLGSQAQVEFTVDSAEDVLRVPAEAVKSEGQQRGLYIEVPPPPDADTQWGKQFVPAVFGITDGTYTEVVRALGDAQFEEGQQVYSKLPRTPSDE